MDPWNVPVRQAKGLHLGHLLRHQSAHMAEGPEYVPTCYFNLWGIMPSLNVKQPATR